MGAIDELDSFLQSHACPSRAAYIARLAAEEFGTNILKYGYDDSAAHRIDLRARVEPDEFQLELTDDGHAFDPTTREDPSADLSLDDRTPGGWGISLVKRLARSVHYQRHGDRNILTVTIDRHPADDDGSGP